MGPVYPLEFTMTVPVSSVLLELDPTDDPIWIYLETQHKRVIERLNTVCAAAKSNYQAVLQDIGGLSYDEDAVAVDIKRCLETLDTPEADSVIGVLNLETNPDAVGSNWHVESAAGTNQWKAVLDIAKSLSETILTTLPSFWRVAQSYTQGKYNKVFHSFNNLVWHFLTGCAVKEIIPK